jgi:hypothetical protein
MDVGVGKGVAVGRDALVGVARGLGVLVGMGVADGVCEGVGVNVGAGGCVGCTVLGSGVLVSAARHATKSRQERTRDRRHSKRWYCLLLEAIELRVSGNADMLDLF